MNIDTFYDLFALNINPWRKHKSEKLVHCNNLYTFYHWITTVYIFSNRHVLELTYPKINLNITAYTNIDLKLDWKR